MFWIILQNGYHKLLRVIYLQLILLFIYVPILIYWGLPLSIMSIVGNIIFLPFLSIFLMLSLVIFTTELLSIPNHIFHTIFIKFSELWLKLLNISSSKWLFGFAHPGTISLLIFILLGFLSLFINVLFIKKKPLHIKCLFTFFIFISLSIFLKYTHRTPSSTTFTTKNQSIIIHHNNNYLTMIVPRMRLQQNSLLSWYFYEIQPQLFKTFGTANIKTIVLLNPTKNMINLFSKNKLLVEHQQLLVTKPSLKKKINSTTIHH